MIAPDGSAPAVTPEDRLYRIVEDGLCIGCGLCESIAGRDRVRVTTVENGYQRPVVEGPLDQETVDRIYDTCPGLRLDTLPGRLLDDDTVIDPVWGPFKRMFSGYASDDAVRVPAASGGVLTALCNFLVEDGRVAFIHHARPAEEDATFGVAHISSDVAGIAAGTGSIYGPSPVLANIRGVLDRGETFAFVGKPCDISALRNYAHFDDRVDALVRYWLTPVCGGIVPPPQMDTFLAKRDLDRADLAWFKYRGDGCPGDVEFLSQDGRRFTANMYEPYGGFDEADWQLPFRCKVCPDGPGEAADIAAGDQWVDDIPDWEAAKTDKGSNAVIVRTAAGIDLIDAAVKSGYLTVDHEITPRFYDTCQHHHVVKKQVMRSRWDGMLAEGRLSPRSQGLRLDDHARANPAEVNAAQMAGTRQRLKNGRNTERKPRARDRIEASQK